MLKLVHEHLNQLWDETGMSLEKIRQNILAANPNASISISKLHRVLSDSQVKLSMEEMLMIIRDGFQRDPNILLAKIGGREYVASEQVDYKGATALLEDFERRETAIRKEYIDQLQKEAVIRENIRKAFVAAKEGFDHAVVTLQANHEAALKKRDDTYDRVVTHLRTQLKDDAASYQQYIADKDEALKTMAEHAGAAMKSMKWWRFSAFVAICSLAAGFIYVVWEITHLDKGATAILIQMVRDGMI